MPRTERLELRLTTEQREQWQAAADADQRTLSDWIRVQLDRLSKPSRKR